MGKSTCNSVKMCREENNVYLKMVTYTNVHYSVSDVISDQSMSAAGDTRLRLSITSNTEKSDFMKT